jgi:hypothetical protein
MDWTQAATGSTHRRAVAARDQALRTRPALDEIHSREEPALGGCRSPDAEEEWGGPPATALTGEGEDGGRSRWIGPGIDVDRQGRRPGGCAG